jgi:predicted 2-oxoglutarate/Fe(II)-dependent dioxygenase YbiX
MTANLKDYIVVLDRVIPDNLCAAVLDEYCNSDLWEPAQIKRGLDAEFRNSSGINISNAQTIAKNPSTRQAIDTALFSCASEALQAYAKKFSPLEVESDSGYELLRYAEGQFYAQHTDSFKGQARAVSCSFALNDDYDGGEFCFFDREMKFKVEKGGALMFPANFMYPHEVAPVRHGTRFSIVTWFI